MLIHIYSGKNSAQICQLIKDGFRGEAVKLMWGVLGQFKSASEYPCERTLKDIGNNSISYKTEAEIFYEGEFNG